MRAGIVEQQERTYRCAVDAVRKESADGKAVSNPMAAVWPHDFCDFSHGSLLEGLAVHLLNLIQAQFSYAKRTGANVTFLAHRRRQWRNNRSGCRRFGRGPSTRPPAAALVGACPLRSV